MCEILLKIAIYFSLFTFFPCLSQKIVVTLQSKMIMTASLTQYSISGIFSLNVLRNVLGGGKLRLFALVFNVLAIYLHGV